MKRRCGFAERERRGGLEAVHWWRGDQLGAEADLSRRLTPVRYRHVLRVAETAAELARRHDVDPVQASLAGLYHDWAREVPEAELQRQARTLGLPPGSAAVLHGPVAARLLPPIEGVDAQVRTAIDRHTTGAPGMSRLDMVVYLADLVEPGRDFPGVEKLRLQANGDLELATLAAMDATLLHVLDRGLPLDLRGVAARNDMLARVQRRGRPQPEPGPH